MNRAHWLMSRESKESIVNKPNLGLQSWRLLGDTQVKMSAERDAYESLAFRRNAWIGDRDVKFIFLSVTDEIWGTDVISQRKVNP